MLKHRPSEGPAELQWGSTLIRETPGVRHHFTCDESTASLAGINVTETNNMASDMTSSEAAMSPELN
jgi:hypothetical protein